MVAKKPSSASTKERLFLGSALAVGACVAACSAPILFWMLGAGLASSFICTPREALTVMGLSGLVAAGLFAIHQRFRSAKCVCANAASAPAGGGMPIACDLSVFGQSERTEHLALARSLWEQARETIEDKDGFTFVFERSPHLEEQIAHWISNEKRCCPFFSFEFDRADATASSKLRISGPEGAKEILAIELTKINPRD